MRDSIKIGIINGPNLNLLGKREPHVYGTASFESHFQQLQERMNAAELHFAQTNSEADLISLLQQWGHEFQGLVVNPGGLSHTSIAIADAMRAVPATIIEVHISSIHQREPYRRQLRTAEAAQGVISGLGLRGYDLAVQYLLEV